MKVYRRSLLEASPTAAANLKRENVLRAISRVKAQNRPPLPLSAEVLELNDLYTTTKGNERFLIANEVFAGNRLLVFASSFFLSLLFAAKSVCMDGTFQTVPLIFNQFYSLNFFYNGKLLPAVYALTKRRTTRVYQRIFSILHQEAEFLNRKFQPKELISDFETAVIQAAKIEFPDVSHRGCFFHFCQA